MVVPTSSPQKQFFRDQFTRYFKTDEPDCIIHIYNIVVSLWSNKNVNTLRKDLGDEEFDKIKGSIDMFQEAYNYAGQLRRALIEARESSSGEKQSIEYINKKLVSVSSKIPIIRQDIIRAYFLLVNNTDLRNIAVESKSSSKE